MKKKNREVTEVNALAKVAKFGRDFAGVAALIVVVIGLATKAGELQSVLSYNDLTKQQKGNGEEELPWGKHLNNKFDDVALPSGTIIAWDPTIRDLNRQVTQETRSIPHGWLMCDGKNGTPDLRGRALFGERNITDAGYDAVLRAPGEVRDDEPLGWVKHIAVEETFAFYAIVFIIKK